MPSYNDIRDDLISQAKQIFGQDIYLGNDSQDYQYISAFANKIYDAFLTCQAVYNSRGPSAAVGVGLDAIVGINGIKRLVKRSSNASVVLSGTPGAIITNGVASDTSGYQWVLPSPLTIGTDGTVTAIATCLTPGPIQASSNTITGIVTPTLGWTGITNPQPAVAGNDTESDHALRSRQSISTANPSQTILEGVRGAVASVSGITRYSVDENDTDTPNSKGQPPHSITVVAEGGTDQDIAQAIFARKGLGCYSNGTTTVTVSDKYGKPTPIRFYRPTYVDIVVVVSVKKLAGYTTQTTSDIQSYVSDFINSLAIGNSSLVLSSLWGAALQANKVMTSPYFSITAVTAARLGSVQGTADIPLSFNEAARGSVANVTVNVVG
ncbi:baseplate J/gp47 family protein [Brevibacillus ginsengisoli]|uniref:baseplate J/gp47 family protein n=1 Tax=Brevibacillus ginsengisoli TaxID=363854 RepID=UPI003CEFD0CA